MSLGKGIKAFGDRAVDATTKEFSQLDEKGVLIPKHFNGLSNEERDEALPVVVLIKEKRSGEIKGRACTDGRKQRLYIPPEDTKSPTVSTESLFLSCLIDAVEKRSIATCDIVGAYLNAEMVDKVYIVIRQKMMDMLLAVNGKKYRAFVHITVKGDRLLYVLSGKVLYGCLKSARLFWEHLKNLDLYVILI